jgi:hypothetical protein
MNLSEHVAELKARHAEMGRCGRASKTQEVFRALAYKACAILRRILPARFVENSYI